MPQLVRIGGMMGAVGDSGPAAPSDPLTDSDAIAFVNALNTAPPTWMHPAINTFFVGMKATTFWPNILGLWLFPFEYAASPSSFVNAKSPGTYDGVVHGGLVHVPGSYSQGNGSDAYVDTTINPVTVGGMQNSIHIGFMGFTPDRAGIVAANGKIHCIARAAASDAASTRLNDATGRTATNADGFGQFDFHRNGSAASNVGLIKNGAALTGSGGAVSATPSSTPITFIGGPTSSTGVAFWSTVKLGMGCVSFDMSAAECATFYGLVSKLFTDTIFARGLTIATIGQSNMEHMFSALDAGTIETNRDLTRVIQSTGWASPNNGNGAVRLANALSSALAKPITLLNFAISATNIASWQSGQSSWTAFTSGLTAQNISSFDMALFCLGENDSSAGTDASTFAAGLATLEANTRTLSGNSAMPFGIVIIGSTAGTDSATDVIRKALLDYVDANASGHVFLAGQLTDQPNGAFGIHYDPATTYPIVGDRYALSIEKQLGAVSVGGGGPKLNQAGATYNSGTGVITLPVILDGGTGLTDASASGVGTGLTGFVVGSSGGAKSISATAFSGTNILLTTDTGLSGVTVTYLAGAAPTVTNPVYDNNTISGRTLGRPLQPSRGAISAS